ncbi:heme o synthase [Thermosynechococcaceae cyanobacterium BACA0444]|uniref:Protoheme IX farnesyltransferase n=1 Tax=Pseudocalidococcus azoricus BACA0444 TaxID=2918990 RepID=A0AAE4FRP3_9CYAN|nr:heme o synthase [Pseudocalidococcus azoricus]MDS3859780.1 heme o synthase [Pseudocalidococcus azoricus BACA0444]
MQDTTWTTPGQRHLFAILGDYYQLTKPRLILLFLITTAAAMEVASQGSVDPLLLLVTLVSGALAAAAANTINCFYDRDIDQIMERTSSRPLPAGRIQPWESLVFAGALAVTAFALLSIFANLLSAGLAMAGIVVYVAVYTHWLKRSSPQNIVIGGAAGAIPPLVGWAAVTGELSWPAWVLFAIIFVWTPPHFWPLAMLIQEDYAKVNVPMLPVVNGDGPTAKQIFIYTLVLLPTTLLLVYPCHVAGWLYGLVAVGLGVGFIYRAWDLIQAPGDKDRARALFKFSILYMMLLCVGLVVDSLPVTQTFIANLTSQVKTLVALCL